MIGDGEAFNEMFQLFTGGVKWCFENNRQRDYGCLIH